MGKEGEVGTLKLAVSSVRGIVSKGEVVKRRGKGRVEREEGKERGLGIYLSDLASMRPAPSRREGRDETLSQTIDDALTDAKRGRRETRDGQTGPNRRARRAVVCLAGQHVSHVRSVPNRSLSSTCSLSISSSSAHSRRLFLLPPALLLSPSHWETRCPRRALRRTLSTSPPSWPTSPSGSVAKACLKTTFPTPITIYSPLPRPSPLLAPSP